MGVMRRANVCVWGGCVSSTPVNVHLRTGTVIHLVRLKLFFSAEIANPLGEGADGGNATPCRNLFGYLFDEGS